MQAHVDLNLWMRLISVKCKTFIHLYVNLNWSVFCKYSARRELKDGGNTKLMLALNDYLVFQNANDLVQPTVCIDRETCVICTYIQNEVSQPLYAQIFCNFVLFSLR